MRLWSLITAVTTITMIPIAALLLCGQAAPLAGSEEAAPSGPPPLHWYEDTAAAATAAATLQRPILHLRLLGRFDESLSCANSRFFRSMLYPDPAIAAVLRKRFVLSWSSERPVPKVTIDFGDGRIVDTTLTGNSAHYVLDAQGRVLDALPGLVAPAHFLAWLERVEQLAQEVAAGDDRHEILAAYHRERAAILHQEQQTAMQSNGILMAQLNRLEAGIGIPIFDAANLAMSKVAIEGPLLEATHHANVGYRTSRQAEDEDYIPWFALAQALGVDTTLAPAVTAAMAQEIIGDTQHVQQVLQQFHRDLAMDTARNGWRLHPSIHNWLAAEPAMDFATLNQRIYAELFLSPASDPWLGLNPHQVYSGLPAGGLRLRTQQGKGPAPTADTSAH